MCDEVGKSMLGRGNSMCKGPGVGTGTARWLLWLEGSDLGQSEGNEVGGVRVTWGLMGLGYCVFYSA